MHWLIDTDAGVDDAIAIALPFVPNCYPDFHLAAITTVTGNVHVDKVNVNVGAILDLVQADVPLFAGCDRPMIAPHEHAEEFHGIDGLGDAGLSKSRRKPEAEHAAIAINRLSRQHDGDFGLIALGPLTNIALAANLDPNLPGRVNKVVVMGGAYLGRGNQSSAAEFNIAIDPESAHIVFDRFHDVTLLPWEVSVDQPMPYERADAIAPRDTPRGRFFSRMAGVVNVWRERFGFTGMPLPDPLAVAVTLDERVIADSVRARIKVDIGSGIGRGLTSPDYRSTHPNVRIVTGVNETLAWDMIDAAWA